jgi:hypothetical protein
MRGLVWLYDPIAEDFRLAPKASWGPTLDIRLSAPRTFGQGLPRTRRGRIAYWLFADGWICPLFLVGICLLAVFVWLAS